MATVYDYVFGIPTGQAQVHCCFHDDNNTSAGIGPDGQYHCFVCGSEYDCHDDIGFIQKYFGVDNKQAFSIKQKFENADKYTTVRKPLSDEQHNYLNGIGISNEIADRYFYNNVNGQLYSEHTWEGIHLSRTWFNAPVLSSYNAGMPKYKYQGVIGGITVPYDDVMKYNSILICEGEKDMYTAKSMGVKSAVAKLGGAMTPIIGGVNFQDKKVVICYDCDKAGRDGAIQDAAILKEKYGCSVKVIDLGLNDKEDLNDYFVKYNHALKDFYDLIRNTGEFTVPDSYKKTKVEKFVDGLTDEEMSELIQLILTRTETITEEE